MELFFFKYVLKISAVVSFHFIFYISRVFNVIDNNFCFSQFFTSSMISGQMWNYIKRPISMFRNNEGIITYIYQYRNAQFIYESYIIFTLCILFKFLQWILGN